MAQPVRWPMSLFKKCLSWPICDNRLTVTFVHSYKFSYKRLGSGHSTKSFLIGSLFLNAKLSMWSLTLLQICFLTFKTSCGNTQCSIMLKMQIVS